MIEWIKGFWEKLKVFLFKPGLAFLWLLFLLFFAHPDVFVYWFTKTGKPFDELLVEVSQKDVTSFINCGLLFMLFIDYFIIQALKGMFAYSSNSRIFMRLTISAFIGFAVVYGMQVASKNYQDLAEWLKIYYIFGLFVLILFYQKMEIISCDYEVKDDIKASKVA